MEGFQNKRKVLDFLKMQQKETQKKSFTMSFNPLLKSAILLDIIKVIIYKLQGEPFLWNRI